MLRVTVLLLVFIALQGYVEGNPFWKDDRSVNVQTRRGPRTLESEPKNWPHFYSSWSLPSFSMGGLFKDEGDYDYDMALLKRRIVALEKSHRELVQSFKQLTEETKKASCNVALVQEVSDQQTQKEPQNAENENKKPLDDSIKETPLVPAVNDEVTQNRPQDAENEKKKPLDDSVKEFPLVPVVSDEVTQKGPQNAENEKKKPLDDSVKEIPSVPARLENPEDEKKPLVSSAGEIEKGNAAENTKKEQPQSVPEATNGDSAGVVATNVDKGTTPPTKVSEMVTPTQNDDTEAVALVNGDEVDKMTTLEDGEKAGSTLKPERVEASVAMEELAVPRVDYVVELNAELESPELVADAESDVVSDQPVEAIDTIGGAASIVEFAGTLEDGVSVAEN